MALVEFTNNQSPYINADNLNNNFNECNNIVASGNGYIKYSDGTMICYGSLSGTSTLSDYWGQFERTNTIDVNYPQQFMSAPNVTLNSQGSIGGVVAPLILDIYANLFTFQLLKANGSEDASYNVHYIAIGKWK